MKRRRRKVEGGVEAAVLPGARPPVDDRVTEQSVRCDRVTGKSLIVKCRSCSRGEFTRWGRASEARLPSRVGSS